MEFTTDQWTWIFNCISHRANDVGSDYLAKKALVSEDESCFPDFVDDFYEGLNELRTLTSIQFSLLSVVDLGDRAALTREELLYNLKGFTESKRKLDEIIENAKSETDDSDGVLGDKAPD